MIIFAIATPDDAPALTAIQKRTFDDDSRLYAGQPVGGPPGYDSIEWQIRIMRQAVYYKILAGERIIGGLIVFNLGDGHYELGRIYIDPDYQNQGIGTLALRFVEHTYPQARIWTLDTPDWAYRNHHFYEKMGYVRVREGDGCGVRLFFYQKDMFEKS